MQHFANFGIIKQQNKALSRKATINQGIEAASRPYQSRVGVAVPDKQNFNDIRKVDDYAASPSGYLGFRNDPYKGLGGMMEEPVPVKKYKRTETIKPSAEDIALVRKGAETDPNGFLGISRRYRQETAKKDPLTGYLPPSNEFFDRRGDARIFNREAQGMPQLYKGEAARGRVLLDDYTNANRT
jgi:hypothetical protein